MPLSQGQSGPQTLSDGLVSTVRISHDGSHVSQDSHGRFQEAVYRGNVWSLATAAAGVTITASQGVAYTLGVPMLAMYNPAGSGKYAVLLAAKTVWASGTAAAQGIVIGVVPSAGVSAAGGNAAVNLLTGVSGGSTMKTFQTASMTGQTVAPTIVDFIGGPTTGALAAAGSAVYAWDYSGLVFCPPGAILGLYAAAAGTNPIVAGSMFWEEIPV